MNQYETDHEYDTVQEVNLSNPSDEGITEPEINAACYTHDSTEDLKDAELFINQAYGMANIKKSDDEYENVQEYEMF